MLFKAKEFWRDIETFSSFTFALAVVARSLIGLGWTFFWELVAALVVSQAVLRLAGNATKSKISSHAANGGILLTVINAYYKSISFLIFTLVLYALVCIAHKKLRKHSWTEILSGLVIGIVTGILAIWLVPQLWSKT